MKIMEIQDQLRAVMPSWKTQADIYKEEVKKYVTSESVILDIGCGHSTFMGDVYSVAKMTIGQDPDQKALEENTIVKRKILGYLDSLSQLEDNSIDIITSSWVLEHLPDPDKLFRQIRRLLKPNGVFISLTPNKYSLITTISRSIPNQYHARLVKSMWGRAEEDTYPTFYKINTKVALKKYTLRHNLKIKKIKYLKDPTYYINSKGIIKLVNTAHHYLIPQKFAEGMLITIVKR
jgi:2-polyprenyl-3-methyl-5-hydroxy-6-metoxy-1,4-benzoquinol methylase